jgi:hypothetical protein
VRRSAEAGDRGADPWQRALLALDEFLDTCADPVYGRVVWQEAPIAMGWVRWEELENKFAFGLIEEHVRALVGSGLVEALPVETMARLAFCMLGAAGQALSSHG